MTRKTTFFEGTSWSKFNNLGLALGMTLKIYTSLAKGLTLKVRKFCGLSPKFVEVTGKLPPPRPILNRVKMKHWKHWSVQKITVLQRSAQITVEVTHKFRIPALKNSIKSLQNIRGGVFWFNLSYQKHSTTEGCFWHYLGKLSWWSSALEMQSLENIRIIVLKKIRGGALFLF